MSDLLSILGLLVTCACSCAIGVALAEATFRAWDARRAKATYYIGSYGTITLKNNTSGPVRIVVMGDCGKGAP